MDDPDVQAAMEVCQGEVGFGFRSDAVTEEGEGLMDAPGPASCEGSEPTGDEGQDSKPRNHGAGSTAAALDPPNPKRRSTTSAATDESACDPDPQKEPQARGLVGRRRGGDRFWSLSASASSATRSRTMEWKRDLFATSEVQVRDLEECEEYTGQLQYDDAIPVAASGSGYLTGLVGEGETIERGAVVYRLSNDPGEAELLAAQQQVASAESQVASASQQSSALSAGPGAAELASAQASLAQAQLSLQNLTAPARPG